jgi:hypothetical protein
MEKHNEDALQELTEAIKACVGKEADGRPYSFVIDAMMNALIHIAQDARPDVSIVTILDYLMGDLKGYQKAAQRWWRTATSRPPIPWINLRPWGQSSSRSK